MLILTGERSGLDRLQIPNATPVRKVRAQISETLHLRHLAVRAREGPLEQLKRPAVAPDDRVRGVLVPVFPVRERGRVPRAGVLLGVVEMLCRCAQVVVGVLVVGKFQSPHAEVRVFEHGDVPDTFTGAHNK
jgi:hypothetical protein